MMSMEVNLTLLLRRDTDFIVGVQIIRQKYHNIISDGYQFMAEFSRYDY